MKKYQDYVIKDGVFVGKFEEMYQEFPDPWNIASQGRHNPVEALALNAAQRLFDDHNARIGLDIGCGLGDLSSRLAATGLQVTGMDCSPSAVAKAASSFPLCHFICTDALDKETIRRVNPDLIVLSELLWYILPRLHDLLAFLRRDLPRVHIVNLLTFYPQGQQQYGTEWFTDLDGLIYYFADRGFQVEEYSQIRGRRFQGTSKTYLCGQWA